MNDLNQLIAEADGPLNSMWEQLGVYGSTEWNLSVTNPERAEVYVASATRWIATTQQALSQYAENDPNPLIDQVGKRFDVIVSRRTMLVNRGFGMQNPALEGLKEFGRAVKEPFENPPVVPIVLLLAGALVLLVLLRR